MSRAFRRTAIFELTLRWKIWWKRFRQKLRGEVPHPLSNSDVPEERRDALWVEYGKWLDRMQASLAERDIGLALVYVPDAYKLAEDLPATDEEQLRSLAAERGIPFASPLKSFEKRPLDELFHVPMDAHISGPGAKRAAEATARLILDGGAGPG